MTISGFRRRAGYVSAVLIAILFLFLMRLNVPSGMSKESDVVVTNFYSCDAYGVPDNSFPRNTTAYFNVTVESHADSTKDVSIHLSAEDELTQSIGSDRLNTTIDPGVSASYIMHIFIPMWVVVGWATAYASLWSGGTPIYSESSTQFYICNEDTTPPTVRLLSPENRTYMTQSVSLVFTVNERTSWIGYSLNGMENVTIFGNITLGSLANGSHKIAVYASDTSGNMGFSQWVYFVVWVIHDVAIAQISYSPEEAYAGELVNVSFLVQNQGMVNETFNVTAYANDTAIETFIIEDMVAGSNATLVSVWNTTNMMQSNYTFSARATAVLGEVDLADNYCLDGSVRILARPDIAVTDASVSKTIIGQGHPLYVNVTIRNRSGYTGVLNVSVYANTTIIQTTLENLTGINSTTVAFMWNSTETFDKGNCAVTAVALPLPDEENASDNTFDAGWVFVTVAGDVTSINGSPDGKVDMRDVGAIITAFGKTPLSLGWDPNKDLNDDSRVDMRDIGLVCINFGKT